MVDNPERLFFYMVPACHIGILEPFVRSIMHVKSYQLGATRAKGAAIVLSGLEQASLLQERVHEPVGCVRDARPGDSAWCHAR
jgi:hypothetical protein